MLYLLDLHCPAFIFSIYLFVFSICATWHRLSISSALSLSSWIFPKSVLSILSNFYFDCVPLWFFSVLFFLSLDCFFLSPFSYFLPHPWKTVFETCLSCLSDYLLNSVPLRLFCLRCLYTFLLALPQLLLKLIKKMNQGIGFAYEFKVSLEFGGFLT